METNDPLILRDAKSLVYCPISNKIMRHPVLLHNGRHYELKELVSWLKQTISPYKPWSSASFKIDYDRHLKITIDAHRVHYAETDCYPDYEETPYLKIAESFGEKKSTPSYITYPWILIRSLISGYVYSESLSIGFSAITRLCLQQNMMIPPPANTILFLSLGLLDLCARWQSKDLYNLFEYLISELYWSPMPRRDELNQRFIPAPVYDIEEAIYRTPVRLKIHDHLRYCPFSHDSFRHPVLFNETHYELKDLADYLKMDVKHRLSDGREPSSYTVIEDIDLKNTLDAAFPDDPERHDPYDVEESRQVIKAYTTARSSKTNLVSIGDASIYILVIPAFSVLLSGLLEMSGLGQDMAFAIGFLLTLTLTMADYALKLTGHSSALGGVHSFFSKKTPPKEDRFLEVTAEPFHRP